MNRNTHVKNNKLLERNEFDVYVREDGYIPAYTRTDLKDELHEKYEFRTDYEIVSQKK